MGFRSYQDTYWGQDNNATTGYAQGLKKRLSDEYAGQRYLYEAPGAKLMQTGNTQYHWSPELEGLQKKFVSFNPQSFARKTLMSQRPGLNEALQDSILKARYGAASMGLLGSGKLRTAENQAASRKAQREAEIYTGAKQGAADLEDEMARAIDLARMGGDLSDIRFGERLESIRQNVNDYQSQLFGNSLGYFGQALGMRMGQSEGKKNQNGPE